MKSILNLLAALTFVFFSSIASAQTNTTTIKVSGECGMCKKTIETAAKEAGALFAEWNVDTKVLTVKFSDDKASTAKIEKAVAAVGYDTEHVKATDEAYNGLHGCCKYERAAPKAKACCEQHAKGGKCEKGDKCTSCTKCSQSKSGKH